VKFDKSVNYFSFSMSDLM